MDARLANPNPLTRSGVATAQETKDDAFRLWMEYGRSCKRVSEATGIPVRTLHSWREADGWEQRRKDAAAAFLPGMHTETAVSLRMAAYHASVRLQQIAYDADEYGIEPNEKEVKALVAIVDRGGYSPVGNKQAPSVEIERADEITMEDLRGLSSDELMRREESYKLRVKR